MSMGSKIGAILTRALVFFRDSNLFLAVGSSAITLATIILTKNPFSWTLIALPFFACLLIYSINRITDRDEDAVSLPERIWFPHRLRIMLLVISLVFYVFVLLIVLQKNLLAFAIGLAPFVIAILYSVFRLKRVFLMKNVSIAAAFCANVLIVPVYYENWSGTWEMVTLFFFLVMLINTILFDIKDIKGDSVFGIQTLPVLLGVPATKSFCYLLLTAVFIVVFPQISLNRESVLLIPCACTIALSTIYAPEGENHPWWYFGILVDGELWILLFSTLFIMIFL